MGTYPLKRSAVSFLLLLSGLATFARAGEKATGLYWFVPDGTRADSEVFDIFGEAKKGLYPNIKKMMESGVYGYSVPVYPSHTPVNFAALMTGCYPEVNGISDGQMRIEGYPLLKPSVSGFSSTAKKVQPAWKIFEDAGKKVVVASIPGSTPPELTEGVTIRGRWGSWGTDFWAVNFESGPGAKTPAGNSSRLFFMGPQLTRAVSQTQAVDWLKTPVSYSPALETALTAYGTTIYALIYDDTDDKKTNYSRVLFSTDKKTVLGDFNKSDSWSDWTPVSLSWGGNAIDSNLKVSLIRVEPDGFIKVRILFDPLNSTTVAPADIADGIQKAAGPMVDFPDNWPAQLNNSKEEKAVFFSEAKMALDWHKALVPYVYENLKPDVFIHDTYTPNQMLESRWWLPLVDKNSARYALAARDERRAAREDLRELYRRLDAVLGEAFKHAGKNSIIVLSSDHGIVPLNRFVRLNNLFAKEGLLRFNTDEKNGDTSLDWAATKVAHLKMVGVYIRPDNLSGPWKRGSGPEYETLRNRVRELLATLKDGTVSPFEKIVSWENAGELRMPKERVPDLLLVMKPGYGLTEEMTKDLDVFRDAKEGGYKQALDAEHNPGLWTPFIITGPGIRKGLRLDKNISNVDQLPTLMKALGLPVPGYMQGKAVEAVFAN